MGEAVIIRDAAEADIASVQAIYSHAVLTGSGTFEYDPPPLEEMATRWRSVTGYGLPDFVAELDGEVVGHVCIQSVQGQAITHAHVDDSLDRAWSAGHGRPAADLATVSSLFTALSARGHGAGGTLLDAAVAWIRAHDLAPCLDVVQRQSVALKVYEARGWIRVGEARPPWLPDDEPPVIAMVLPDNA